MGSIPMLATNMKYAYRAVSILCQTVVFSAAIFLWFHLGLSLDLSAGGNFYMGLAGVIGVAMSGGLAVLAEKFKFW